ncbi:IPT/TIG domain-containing protein [Streptomyces sp. NPDC079020]|uniref:IPT/TIG domain-containing protein n=1 Tax=Streptomyces sp. NPDC079020 TaxID=3365722 RepID=UPI0037D7A925
MPISPNQGSIAGSTVVTITGTNLAGTTAVRFGTRPATAVTNVSPTQITALSPSGTGEVAVAVTTPGGTSNPTPYFYIAPALLTPSARHRDSSSAGTPSPSPASTCPPPPR